MPVYNSEQGYAWSYNDTNDVYIVRGIYTCEACFYPRQISCLSSSFVDSLKEEYSLNRPGDELKAQVSYSDDKYYAVLDFHNRTFSNNEILGMVPKAKPKSVRQEENTASRKRLSLFGKFDKK